MGATNIEFQLDGSKTFQEVVDKFKELRARDSAVNGHQYGYSGDFQTVHGVKNHGDKVFDSQMEAEDYCLANAEKWENLVAVKYKVVEQKVNTTAARQTQRVNALGVEYDNCQTDAEKNFTASVAKSAFVTCKNCKSRLSITYLARAKCPLCSGSLLSKRDQKRIAAAEKRFRDAKVKLAALISEAKSKAAAKSKKTRWLVAGWAAT